MLATVVFVATAIAALVAQGPERPPAPQPGANERCVALASIRGAALPNNTTTIRAAVLNAASAARPAANPFEGPTPALPEHCDVQGTLNERQGLFSQRYAIAFRLRLPTQWNGGFFFQGGGGTNGNVGNALGALQGQQPTVALALGYAVVSQDSGHDNTTNADPQRGGAQAFGFDPQARIDFGYNSYDEVTRLAKALIERYYGQAPRRSYYVGCSEGGREGMMMAQRFPQHFDGVLSCAPGFRLPQAALAAVANAQIFAAVAREAKLFDPNGRPFLNRTFSDSDLALVTSAVLDGCDGLDGLTDGLIDDFPSCTTAVVEPRLRARVCRGAKDDSCLSAAQVDALVRVFSPTVTSSGETVYATRIWDAGIGGRLGQGYNQGWRVWKIGAFTAETNTALDVTLSSTATAAIFMTPPVAVATTGGDHVAAGLGLDIDRAFRALGATAPPYTQSALEFMKADSTDLSAFRARGGKLLLVHGVSDPVFSIVDTIDWWRALDAASGGTAAAFARLFAVPGMNHCAGGPATDRFDAFSALVDWVEKGIAPERIVATAGPAAPWPGRTRPLCVYPRQARYSGSGSIEEAANFVCR